jgi:predicted membrane protein
MKRRASIHIDYISSSIRAAIMRANWVRERSTRATVTLTVILLAAFCGTSVPSVHAWLSGRVAVQETQPDIPSSNFTTFNVSGSGSGVLQGSLGISIDAGGDIAGVYLDGNYVAHGFVRSASAAVTTFDAPGAGSTSSIKGSLVSLQGTIPIAINTNGTIVGTYLDSRSCYHGFLRAASGAITEFDVPGATTTYPCTPDAGFRVGTKPIAINSAGIITGTYADSSGGYHGFVRATNGTITTFDAPGGTTGVCGGFCRTIPTGIDTAGDIVGSYADSNEKHHGFIRPANGGIVTFDIPNAAAGKDASPSDYEGTVATSMNDSGTVIGTYTDANIVRHGFIRSASGATTSFDNPGAGTGGLGNHIHEGTAGLSIDTAGDVVGVYLDANAAYHGFLRLASGAITTIDAPGAGTNALEGTVAFHVNDSGQIAGAYADSNLAIHGFLLALPVTATPTPTFSPAPGSYTNSQTVTISDTTQGASIYYTTDGTTPTTSSNLYTGAITVGGTETLEAIAVASDYSQSAVATATYTITGGTPIASLSETRIYFGAAPLGGSSGTMTITLTNMGNAPLVLSGNPAITAPFTILGSTCTAGSSISTGSSCKVDMTLTPASAGRVVGTLTFTDNASPITQTVTLNGAGLQPFHEFDSDPPVPTNFDVDGLISPGCSSLKYGCAITTTATVLTALDPTVTPVSLDAFLIGDTIDPGYKQYADETPPNHCNLNWAAIPSFELSHSGGSVDLQMIDAAPESNQTIQGYLTTHLVENQVVIIQLHYAASDGNSGTHYIAALGPIDSTDSDWYIVDPGWPSTAVTCPSGSSTCFSTLSGHLNAAGFTLDLAKGAVNITFNVTRAITYASTGTTGALVTSADSPVELLVTDPQGRQLGYLTNGSDVFNIPTGSYFVEYPIANDAGTGPALGDPSGAKIAYIPSPASGTYNLTVTGTASGPYNLRFEGVATNGSAQSTTMQGTAFSGSISQYLISYSSTPGVPFTVTSFATPTVTVTPSTSSVTTTQGLMVTITVSGGTSNPTPTGSVTLGSGSYSSTATTLSGGSATINIPAGSLAIGSDTLMVNYSPDSSSSSTYNSATGTSSAVMVAQAKTTPTVTVTPSSSSITTAQSVTVTAVVVGGPGNPTPTGSVTLSSSNYTSTATTLGGGTATINVPAGSLLVGSDTLTTSYLPDSASSSLYNNASGTASVTVTTAVSPSFTVSGTAVTVSPGATTGNTSTMTVTPSGGFTGSVALTATLTSSPAGAQYPPTLSFGSTTPVNITGTTAGTATLTVSTTAATSAALAYSKSRGLPWYSAGGAALACLLFFGIPTRRRSWRTLLGMVLLLVALGGGVACGGGGGGGGGTGNPGTTAGAYTVTVKGTSGSLAQTTTLTVTVN